MKVFAFPLISINLRQFSTKIYCLEYQKSAMKFFGSEMTPSPPPSPLQTLSNKKNIHYGDVPYLGQKASSKSVLGALPSSLFPVGDILNPGVRSWRASRRSFADSHPPLSPLLPANPHSQVDTFFIQHHNGPLMIRVVWRKRRCFQSVKSSSVD